MDLGLDTLSDDQLVELINEACIELAVRDPIVRKLAQGCITNSGSILPRVRRVVRDIVAEENTKELGEEDEEDHNPSPWAGPAYHSSPPAPTVTTHHPPNSVMITMPVGFYSDEYTPRSIERKYTQIIGRSISIVPLTTNPWTFRTVLSDAEIDKIKSFPFFVSCGFTRM